MQKVGGTPLDHMLTKCCFKGWNIVITKYSFYLQSSEDCEAVDLCLHDSIHLCSPAIVSTKTQHYFRLEHIVTWACKVGLTMTMWWQYKEKVREAVNIQSSPCRNHKETYLGGWGKKSWVDIGMLKWVVQLNKFLRGWGGASSPLPKRKGSCWWEAACFHFANVELRTFGVSCMMRACLYPQQYRLWINMRESIWSGTQITITMLMLYYY